MTHEEKEKYLYAYKSTSIQKVEKSMKITVKKKHMLEEHKEKEEYHDI